MRNVFNVVFLASGAVIGLLTAVQCGTEPAAADDAAILKLQADVDSLKKDRDDLRQKVTQLEANLAQQTTAVSDLQARLGRWVSTGVSWSSAEAAFNGVAASAQTACDSGSTLLSGSCACPGGTVMTSGPMKDAPTTGWFCNCATGKAWVQVLCAKPL